MGSDEVEWCGESQTLQGREVETDHFREHPGHSKDGPIEG